MIKILAIGNSFSQDGTVYLHNLAEDAKVVDIAIGGCSLKTHYENTLSDAPAYIYELNGVYQERQVSVKEALTEDEWDIVTLQQASHDSGIEETYYPYILHLAEYVKKYSPKSKIYIQKTWAYEKNSSHPAFERYDHDQETMYRKLSEAYLAASDGIDAPLIPVGDVIQELRKTVVFNYDRGSLSICRDGFHLDLIYGRYAAAATWYETLLGRSILDNPWIPEGADKEVIKLVKETVHSVCKKK